MKYIKRKLWFYSTGSYREEIGESELLTRKEPLVVLGEPGMGKSELLVNIARETGAPRCTARQLILRHDPYTLIGSARTIIIDALDEVAASKDGDAVDLVLKRLGELGYPQFIISCRVADWQAATSVEAISEQYDVSPLQLHLIPLTKEEQISILGEKQPIDWATKLVDHYSSFGLDFLGNPQTLDLLSSIAPNSALPTTKGELFSQAIDTLRVEHKASKGARELSKEAALDAAGAAFSAIILTGSSEIVRTGSAAMEQDSLHISEVDDFDQHNVSKILDSRLFKGEEDSFTYWHRRIGEFLGAYWLSKQSNTRLKRKRLLQIFHSERLVPSYLRGIHAWLARDPQLAESVIGADPIGVIEYGDTDAFSPKQARCLLDALQSLAEQNPRFYRDLSGRADVLVSPPLAEAVLRILDDKDTEMGLRLFLTEQLSSLSNIEPYQEFLNRALFDRTEPFSIRHNALKALVNHGAGDWPNIAEKLRCHGDHDSNRLAYNLVELSGVELFTDRQLVEILLAHDGLTICALPQQTDEHSSIKFWRLEEKIPDSRLDGILEELTSYLSELLPDHSGIEENEIIDFVYKLVNRRLKYSPLDPLKLWSFLTPYFKQHHFERDSIRNIRDWLSENKETRRAIQKHVLLSESAESTKDAYWYLHESKLNIYPNEDDVVSLLTHLQQNAKSGEKWREILSSIGHDKERGRLAREAAKHFARDDHEALNWINGLAQPRMPQWQEKQKQQALAREAERKAQYAKHRKDFGDNLQLLEWGDLRYTVPAAKAYLKQFRDIGNETPAHERIAEWLGTEIAEVAHKGFEAFLKRQPARPTAVKIAISFARQRRWPAASVIVAALAERFRKDTETPFEDLSDERLMSGLFELWHSRIDNHAGLDGLLDRIESELKARNAWERSVRLYIVPQLKKQSTLSADQATSVDHLYAIMRSQNDAEMATNLALEWLNKCPKLHPRTEAELLDRVLHSSQKNKLTQLSDIRSVQTLQEERRRNWDAVQLIVDFPSAKSRIDAKNDPHLLWAIRERMGYRQWENQPQVPIEIDALEWIVQNFRSVWPVEPHPTGAFSGDTNLWDASEFIAAIIAKLGDETSEDALRAMTALKNSPKDSYTDYIRSVSAEQAQKLVEITFKSPSLQDLRSIINAGPPANSGDLQAIMLDVLETAQDQVRGSDVDWYKNFFKEDGSHKGEEICRDELIKIFRMIEPSLEYMPESHGADDKRVDIVVRANKSLIVPIEIKGQWHRELWTAADRQLDHLYVNDWRAERGVYLILWFGSGVKLPKSPDYGKRPHTPQELKHAIIENSEAAKSGRIDVIVFDLTRPAPC